MAYHYGLSLACALMAFNGFAEESGSATQPATKQIIVQAINDIVETPRREWLVQIAHYENEEGDITSSIEHYRPSPTVAQRWTLIEINGEKPTEKQQKKFVKNKREQNKGKGNSFSLNLKTLIKQESLTLLSENDDDIRMSFQVQMDRLGDDAIGKLQGALHYDKQHQYIKQIEITNNAEFSPMFSAKISQLSLTFQFIKIDQAILPKHQELRMKGTFAYFTEIDEVSTVTYSDYQHSGASSE